MEVLGRAASEGSNLGSSLARAGVTDKRGGREFRVCDDRSMDGQGVASIAWVFGRRGMHMVRCK